MLALCDSRAVFYTENSHASMLGCVVYSCKSLLVRSPQVTSLSNRINIIYNRKYTNTYLVSYEVGYRFNFVLQGSIV